MKRDTTLQEEMERLAAACNDARRALRIDAWLARRGLRIRPVWQRVDDRRALAFLVAITVVWLMVVAVMLFT